MGDRYYLTLHCCYCGNEQEVYYAPTCYFNTFGCDKCKKVNIIIDEAPFKAEEVTAEQLTEDEITHLNIFCPNKQEQETMLKQNRKRLKQWLRINNG
jgi:hypothetical protein